MTSPSEADLRSLDQLSGYIQEITEALASCDTERQVIEIVLTPAVKVLGAVAGVVLLVDQTDQQLKIAGSQGYEDGALTLWQARSIDDDVLISDILRMKKALYFEDAGSVIAAYPELERRTSTLKVVANATLPMFLDGRPLGVIVLNFTEPHDFPPAERRFLTILSGQCAVALGRAEATRTLESRVEERTRQLEEERAALAAFVAFTEAVGSEADLFSLAREAISVLLGRFPGASAAYYEEEGTLWKGRVWSDNLNTGLIEVISAGLPSDTPIFAQVIQTRQPVFTDGWDAERGRIASSEDYTAAANYPLMIDGKLRSVLSIGLRETRSWNDADRALLRAVGRGLNLALERTETARVLMKKNAELQAHTRALDAFAELTRDLVLTTDPLLLIRRVQEVVMSMLAEGTAMYFVLEGERWSCRVQHGTLHSPELQASIDAGLPYADTRNLLIPWTTRQPYYQSVYDQNTDQLALQAGNIGASATLPLQVGGERIGVLGFALLDQRTWSSVDRVVLKTGWC
ncbi:GAF domain-containing protein (plasmid) [Deinococcus radiomollis]|uniref:GAF domain-containing protein n=1 Tax=Deinococcus radiomollis TaxID=468916 RepID=UPI0038911CBE